MTETMLKEAVGKAEKKEPIKIKMQKAIGPLLICAELMDKPEEAMKYTEKYNDLVSDIAGILKGEGTGIVKRILKSIGTKRGGELREKSGEKQFFIDVWGAIKSNIKLKEQTSSLFSDAIKEGALDCDGISFLMFDVGRALGLELEVIITPDHALVAGKEFYFDSSISGCSPIEELSKNYPVIYSRFTGNDSEKIISYAYASVGTNLASAGRDREAVEKFCMALYYDPENIHAINNRACAYLELRMYKEGLQDVNRVLKVDPNDADCHNNKASACLGLGREKDALREISKAIDIDPTRIVFYENRGRLYQRMGKKKEADADFEQAAALKDALKKEEEAWRDLEEKLKRIK